MGTVLAISSSPRRNGNSELLLQSFIEGVEQKGSRVEFLRLSDLYFGACRGCDCCAVDGECILRDDMVEVYSKVSSAAGMVMSTPIYFGSLSAQLKMFIDRFQGWWHAKYHWKNPPVKPEERRPGFFISAGALQNKAYGENALLIARVFYHIVNYHYYDCLFCRGVDEKGAVKKRPEVLQQAHEAGIQFAEACPER